MELQAAVAMELDTSALLFGVVVGLDRRRVWCLVSAMTLRARRLLWSLTWLVGGAACAQSIQWSSTQGANNQASSGAPMTAAFSFELGVFTSGFVPSPSNESLWAANWVGAQRVAYNDGPNQQFAAQLAVVDNLSPFTLGAPAYVWGFQGGQGSSDWILFRKSDWTWPNAFPVGPPPFPLVWNASAATAVVGTLNTLDIGGNPRLMQAVAVTGAAIPPTSWAQWQLAELTGEALNRPEDDPDHDGTNNLLEFVFGTSPEQAGPPPATPVQIVTVAGQRFLQVSIPRRSDHPALLTVQVSPDLANWSDGPAATVVVEDSLSALVVRDLTPLGGTAPQRFMRLKAELLTP